MDDDLELTCNAKKENECTNEIGCSWCEAGAVPSSCHSIENAKKLPAGVFDCVFPEDVAELAEETAKPVFLAQEYKDDDLELTCNAKKENECTNEIGCSWCEAGAVPSSCHSIENAKKLPAGVF